MLDAWRHDAVRDVHAEMSELTMQIACTTLFGTDACPNPVVVGEALNDAMEALARRWKRLLPVPGWVPTPANRLFRRALRSLDAIVEEIVARRRKTAGDGADLLSSLLLAQDENGSAFTDRQLLDEVRTIFLAGHETTALALTYSLYLLSEHPGCRQRSAMNCGRCSAARRRPIATWSGCPSPATS